MDQTEVAPELPFNLFGTWLEAATGSEPNDPNAMILATCGPELHPSARMVLLKGLDQADGNDRGFVFYTNLGSRKADELRANPFVTLLFHWKTQRRQVRIEGRAQPVRAEEADVYFASRPRLSQLGAWASDQSRPLSGRATLERRLAEVQQQFGPDAPIPRPQHWSGFRVIPATFEFWQDMPYRLHDRTVFLRNNAGWNTAKLYP